MTRVIDGRIHEPYEHLIVDTTEEFIGELTENLSGCRAELADMKYGGSGNVRIEYSISTRGLIGFSSFFLRTVGGSGVENRVFTGYRLMEGEIKSDVSRVLVASESGVAVTYGLLNAQGRGDTFIEPGTPVYMGMIVGKHSREEDIVINVCNEKKLTNVRSSTDVIAKRLSPWVKMSLEEALAFISSDELVEVTPELPYAQEGAVCRRKAPPAPGRGQRGCASDVNLEDRTCRGAITWHQPYSWHVVAMVSSWRAAFVPLDCRGVARHCDLAVSGESDSGGASGIGSSA